MGKKRKKRPIMPLKQYRDLFEQAKSYAYDYMDNVNKRTVFPDEDAIARLNAFDEPLPDDR